MAYALLAAAFVAWFGASVAAQFGNRRVLKLDWLGLLPDFRFFAPRPVTRDFRVFARAIDHAATPLAWRELLACRKRWWCFIWNPQHRVKKAVFDLYRDLDRFRSSSETWHLSWPYLVLLHCATNALQKEPQASSVQFMICCYAGYEEQVLDILFVSNAHTLDTSSTDA